MSGELADAKRKQKDKRLEKMIRGIIRDELQRSPRKKTIDLEREKNKDVCDDVKVELIESTFKDAVTVWIMDAARKFTPEMLRTKSIETILDAMSKAVGDGAVCSASYVKTNGQVPIIQVNMANMYYALIKINGIGVLQFVADDALV
ncbi:MAG: hypothetical protein Q8R82_18200 [Hyphomonadaceae bacterium]|nr:hypothetical protein [Hyphomonadaceae bacterium]